MGAHRMVARMIFRLDGTLRQWDHRKPSGVGRQQVLSSVSGSGGYYIINGNGQNAGTTEVGCGGVNASPPAAMTNYLGGTAWGILCTAPPAI